METTKAVDDQVCMWFLCLQARQKKEEAEALKLCSQVLWKKNEHKERKREREREREKKNAVRMVEMVSRFVWKVT